MTVSISSIVTSLPDQYVKPKDWTEDYYKKNVLAIAAIQGMYYTNGLVNNSGSYADLYQNYLFYKGWQDGKQLEFIKEAIPGVGLAAVYIPGYELNRLIDNQLGQYVRAFKNIPKSISVRSLNPDVRSEYNDFLNLMLFLFKNKNMQDELNNLGLKFKGLPDFTKIQSENEVKMWAEENFIENSETGARYIAKALLHKNNYLKVFNRAALNACISGSAMLWEDEAPYNSFLPSWRCIDTLYAGIDRRRDDDLGGYQEYVAEITFMSKGEAAALFNLNTDERKQLDSLVLTSPQVFLSQFGFKPYWTNQFGSSMVSVIRARWHSVQDMRMKIGINSFGNKAVRRLPFDSDKQTNEWMPCVREAVMIGGTIIKNAGIRKNQTIFNSVTGLPSLGATVITPNMLFGAGISLAEKLKPKQQYRDYIWLTIQRIIARDYGIQLAFDSSKYPNGKNIYSLMSEMKNAGIIEYNGEQENSDESRGNKLPVDVMNLGPGLQAYIGLLDMIDRDMKADAGTSDIALGQQTAVIGKGVQENTVALNTVQNIPYMELFMTGINEFITNSVDQARMNIYANGGADRKILEIGRGEVAAIRLSKGECLDKLNIYIDTESSPSDNGKAVLVQVLMGMANKGSFPDDGLIKITEMIENGSSYSELVNTANMYYSRMIEQRNREMAAQAAIQESIKDKGTDATIAQAEINRETANEVADKKLQETIIKESSNS